MTDKKQDIDQDLIRQLASLLKETDLTEIEIEGDGRRVRVARQVTTVSVPMAMPAAVTMPAGPGTPAAGPGAINHPGLVTSPMVGTAYRSPEPGARPYVDIGDAVSEGQTLLIVEAMKTMNQIAAPRAGRVTRIMVEDGQPVEFGEPLLIVE
ncbi:MAG: acetyl-CoA carboxylase biotin carboxyl carrier protein [Bauldia sp.]|nr:acetyl-CoA carboxylase biotin carboxyl carrier protein [Bauldia sp.]